VSRPTVDELAEAMRKAYSLHDQPRVRVVPWAKADPEKQEAWRVCARTALVLIFGTENVS